MESYDENRPCPKCGIYADTRYAKETDIIVRVCRRCGYEWEEKPLDAKPEPAKPVNDDPATFAEQYRENKRRIEAEQKKEQEAQAETLRRLLAMTPASQPKPPKWALGLISADTPDTAYEKWYGAVGRATDPEGMNFARKVFRAGWEAANALIP